MCIGNVTFFVLTWVSSPRYFITYIKILQKSKGVKNWDVVCVGGYSTMSKRLLLYKVKSPLQKLVCLKMSFRSVSPPASHSLRPPSRSASHLYQRSESHLNEFWVFCPLRLDSASQIALPVRAAVVLLSLFASETGYSKDVLKLWYEIRYGVPFRKLITIYFLQHLALKSLTEAIAISCLTCV